MKKFYSILSFSLFINAAIANPVITADHNNGKWRNNSIWDINRQPKDGDTVIIPAGITVIIDNNVNLQNATLYVKVFGNLELDGGKLKLDENSVIILLAGATITSHSKSNEQITIGNELKFKGKDDVLISGPAVANSSTSVSPNGFAQSGSGALPVKFIGFDLTSQNNNVLVEWSTAQENNSKFFEIQRSENGGTWMTVGTVYAAGNSNEVKKYTYTDHSVTAAIVYYRIRQVDIDGRFDITIVRTLKMSGQNELSIKISSGNNKHINVYFSKEVKSSVSVKVLSMNGQVVYQSSFTNPVGQQILAVNNNLRGIYVVTLTDGNMVKASSQVIL